MKDLDLHAEARSVTLPPGDIDAVVTRGATLAGRRRRVVAGGLTVALVAVSAGIYNATNDPSPVPVIADNANATRGDVGIRWEKVTTAAGLSFTTNMTQDALYAVSTGPGRSAASEKRRVVWHSEDGVDWSQVADLGNDLYIANLADRGTRLYGVGTGAATAAVSGRKPTPPLVVGTSDDGGRTWSKQTLPIDVAAISAKSTELSTYAVDIATTKDAVVAIASLYSDLDVPMVLPPGKTAPHGWAYTETGVDILGDGPGCPAGTSVTPPGEPAKPGRGDDGSTGSRRYQQQTCFSSDGRSTEVSPQDSRGVVTSYTWDQLGVNGDLLRAVRAEPMVFRAAAGSSTFERVQAPEIAGLDGPGLLERDGDGVLLVGQKNSFADGPDPVLYRSTDGVTWTAGALPPGFTYATSVGRLNNRTALIGESPSGATLWVSDGAGNWSTTSLRTAVDPSVTDKANVGLVAAAVGPLGVVAVVNVMRDPIAEGGGIEITQDGYTLRILNDRWAAVVTDRAGKEVARSDGLMMSRGDEGPLRQTTGGGVVLVDPVTDATLTTFSPTSVRNAMRDGIGESGYEAKFRLIASRDGVTWSDASLSDLAGESVANVFRVLMAGERAVVAVSPAAKNADDVPKQIAIVGTPR